MDGRAEPCAGRQAAAHRVVGSASARPRGFADLQGPSGMRASHGTAEGHSGFAEDRDLLVDGSRRHRARQTCSSRRRAHRAALPYGLGGFLSRRCRPRDRRRSDRIGKPGDAPDLERCRAAVAEASVGRPEGRHRVQTRRRFRPKVSLRHDHRPCSTPRRTRWKPDSFDPHQWTGWEENKARVRCVDRYLEPVRSGSRIPRTAISSSFYRCPSPRDSRRRALPVAAESGGGGAREFESGWGRPTASGSSSLHPSRSLGTPTTSALGWCCADRRDEQNRGR